MTNRIMLLMAILAVSFYGCGGDDDDKESEENAAADESTQDGGEQGIDSSITISDDASMGDGATIMGDGAAPGPVDPPPPAEDYSDIMDDYPLPDDPNAPMEALPPLPEEKTLPIVFVHGFAGSGEQYQSHAMRWVANGYPIERIRAYDHHGGMSGDDFVGGLDEVVDGVLEEFDAEQVFLVGHSRGTMVSTQYLGDPVRAAKVAKYVAVDGGGCPASVECIAVRALMFPPQTHVEVCTSPESFIMQYEFFMGEKPEVVHIVPQEGMVEIAGRAVDFPANTGRDGTTLEVYEVDEETGIRETDEPLHSTDIGADGNWGPFEVDPAKHYEMTLLQEDEREHHFYPQRFLRDSNLVRLLSGSSDSETRLNTHTSDDHSAIIVIRMREWHAVTDPDVLEISTKSPSGDQDPVDAIVPEVGTGNIAIHIHDDEATPKETTLAGLPYFSSQPFQYGVDLYMPAADPPDGTITIKNIPRGDTSRPQVINFPNWASSTSTTTVMFTDYPQP